jgi:hypothetical protein
MVLHFTLIVYMPLDKLVDGLRILNITKTVHLGPRHSSSGYRWLPTAAARVQTRV